MKENEEEVLREETPEPAEHAELVETPEEVAAKLRAELDARTREAEENHNRFLRACADLDNYRKRSEKEKADAIAFANETIIEDILAVADNLERALEHACGESDAESLKEGVKLTLTQMHATLKKYGLQEIKSVGEKFDPSLHHAISHEETDSAPEHTVVKEFQKGYILKGRLLRPAMVAVAKRPEVH